MPCSFEGCTTFKCNSTEEQPPFDPALKHVARHLCLSCYLGALAKASLGSNLSNLAARLVLRCVGCGGGEFAAAAALLPPLVVAVVAFMSVILT
jgi:hypothetical protein